MSAMHARLGAAIEDDLPRFSGADFADARLGSVLGSVKRRRAARAAGVGGVSVIGASALAVGAVNLPGISSSLGFAPAAGTVVCTTSTPSALVAKALVFPSASGFAIIDDATNTSYFLDWDATNEPQAWNMDGTKKRFEDVGGSAELVLASGARVVLPSGGGVQAPDGVTVMTPREFEDFVTPGPPAADANGPGYVGEGEPPVAMWLLMQDGVQIAKVEYDGTVLFYSFMNGDTGNFVLPGGRANVSLQLPDGTFAQFTLNGDELVVVGTGATAEMAGALLDESASGEPVSACVTTTPEPSESASPTASAAPAPSASATPNPSVSTARVAQYSPFQCGYVFATDKSGSDNLQIFGSSTTDSDIHSVFEEWYGNQAPTTEVGDSGALAFRAALVSAEVRGATSTRDPASDESVAASRDYEMPAVGFTFVAVRDGAVVGTVTPGANGQTPGVVVDRASENGAEEAFLWDLDAFTPCGATSLDNAQIYAVAGYGEDGTYTYAWHYLAE